MRNQLRATARRLGARTMLQKIQSRPGAALAALAGTTVLSASLAGAPFAQASTAPAKPGVTGHHVKVNGSAAAFAAHIGAYWTRDRMRSAHDADVIPLPPPKPGHRKLPQVHEPTGQPGRVAGAAPTQAPAGGIRSVPKAHHATPADGRLGSVWPGPWYEPPATTTGKVFFTTTGNGQTENWVCSGSTVNSGGKDAVITAAHCVYGSLGGQVPGETWHTNWVFVPDYSNGYAPYGTWTANQLWTMTNYVNTGGSLSDEADDIGAAVMNTNSYGQHIVNVVGGQGIAWNYQPNLYVYDVGYPAESPFNGQVLDYCNGYEFPWGPGTMGLNCNFTGGSSGGPWLAFFNGEFGYINGLNDYGYLNLPGYIFSAYFGNNAANLYNAVAGL